MHAIATTDDPALTMIVIRESLERQTRMLIRSKCGVDRGLTFRLEFCRIVLRVITLCFFCGIFFLLANFLCARGVSHTREFPWNVGESLNFEIKWGVIPAGSAAMEVKAYSPLQMHSDKEQISAYQIEARAISNAFVDLFYKVRNVSVSWYDPLARVSHRFEQQIREGKYHKDQVMELDWKKLRFKNKENVKGREPKIEEGELHLPAVDILSSLYLARTNPLEAGKEYIFDVHSGSRTWPLVLKVLKKESVKVPAGTFDCFLVEPFLRETGLFLQKGKKLQVWMTADERKMPVLMKAEIFIGHISAELKEYKVE